MAHCGPANGPDLGLFCFLGQVVGALAGGQPVQSSMPPGGWVALVAAVLIGAVLTARLLSLHARAEVARRESARQPAAYVQCPGCRAVSPEGRDRCYSCGQPLSGATVRLEVAAADDPAARNGTGQADRRSS